MDQPVTAFRPQDVRVRISLGAPLPARAAKRQGPRLNRRLGSRFPRMQSICQVSADRTCVTCRQVDRGHDAVAAAVVPVVCKSDAGRREADAVCWMWLWGYTPLR